MSIYILTSVEGQELTNPMAFVFDPLKKFPQLKAPEDFYPHLGLIPQFTLTTEQKPKPLMQRVLENYDGGQMSVDLRKCTKVVNNVMIGQDNDGFKEPDLYPLARIIDTVTDESFDVYHYALCVFYDADENLTFITRID